MGWGRRCSGQRRSKAVRHATWATARAQGLGRAGRRARRALQAPQDGRILPPLHVQHNLAERIGLVMGSSAKAVDCGNAAFTLRKTRRHVRERRS